MKTQVISWNHVRDFEMDSHTLIVDIRDPEEYAKSHFSGAVNIPYAEVERHIQRLQTYSKLVFYCDHGSRSLMMAKRLARMGMTTYSILGGYEAKKGV